MDKNIAVIGCGYWGKNLARNFAELGALDTIRLRDSKKSRNKLQTFLVSKGIYTAIYYPLSLHLQEVYKSLGYGIGDFPVSEAAQDQVLSLPIYPEMSEAQVEEVVGEIKKFLHS